MTKIETNPILVLAPNVSYPTRDGPSIHIDQRFKALSTLCGLVDIVTKNSHVQYEFGSLKFNNTIQRKHRQQPRWLFGIKALLNRRDYLSEMLLTPEAIQRFYQFAANPLYKTVVLSPLQSLNLLNDPNNTIAQPDRLIITETHDDMYAWYQHVGQRSSLAMKLISLNSINSLNRLLNAHHKKSIFFHVSEADKKSYESRFPAMRENSFIVALGSQKRNTSFYNLPTDKIRLLYIGGLGVQMNLDAIHHFGEKYYPALFQRFGEALEVVIAGRNPSANVIDYCKKMGWVLRPNLSETELDELYLSTTYSLLPFEYMWGSKNKLMESLAYGIPFLATRLLCQQVADTEALYPCLFSDSPEEWANHVAQHTFEDDLSTYRQKLINFANRHSWETNAEQIMSIINQNKKSFN